MAGNSSTVVTDLVAAAAITPSTATAALASAANGPITDVQGVVKLLQLKAQEMRAILNYLLGGGMSTPAGGTTPTGGIVTNGNDSVLYGLLAGVFNDLV
jgi:hypothetical protein